MMAADPDEAHDKALYAYRLLAEETSDIVIIREPDGAVDFVSAALEKILGRTTADVDHANFLNIVHPDDIDRAYAIHAIPLPGHSLSQTLRVVHPDGHDVWLETTTRGIFDTKTGALRHILSISHDVTQHILHERRLKAAQERAEAASKAKSRFLANMSHELRTPLNAVIGFTDMMRQRTFGPLGNDKYEEYATLIYDSGQLLLDLISDMLDMAKIEAGKLDLNLETVDFTGTIEDSVRMLRDRAEDAGLELSIATPGEPLFAIADRRAVKQIMLNLLSNAIKFTPAGGSIGVNLTCHENFVAIAVCDTGIGIAASDLERLGRPFEQVEGDPMIAKNGAGLGLALVRALTEKHGGNLTITSEEGIGTEVMVTFPLKAGNRAAA